MTRDEMIQHCACLVAAHCPDLAPSHVIDRAVTVAEAYENHFERIFKSETRERMSLSELRDEFENVCDRDAELQLLRHEHEELKKKLRGSCCVATAAGEKQIDESFYACQDRVTELRRSFCKSHSVRPRGPENFTYNE